MSKALNVGGNGTYNGYSDLLAFYQRKSKECPKGVSLKLQSNKYLLLQFVHPDTGKRNPKPCGVNFTEEGIIQAVSKAHKVKQALDTIKTASEFWEWYDKEILGVNKIENDLKTYREIFTEIEDKYWNSRNKNTKRKRSKDIPNDVKTFDDYYGAVFERFTDWNKYPTWDEIKAVLFSWNQGSKSFKNAYAVIKNIIQRSPNAQSLLEKLTKIDGTQTEFNEKQSISLEEFLKWYDEAYQSTETLWRERDKESRLGWLWVTSMCVLYGLRPTEIAAAQNLTKPIVIDGVTIPALTDPNNKDLLLYIGDFTYFGVSIKTGNRVCKPVITNKEMLKRLQVQYPKLPIYTPKEGTKAKYIPSGFDQNFGKALKRFNCPVTQKYAFRHLFNQLGEKYGIPQEIRARMLGHSTMVNDSVYKKRSNIKTTIDLLTNHSKQPLSYDLAKSQLENYGFDLEDTSVRAILRIVYI